MDRKAEKILTDATKFPRESLRERLARMYGIDAVALSGPCEGRPLVECIVDQLENRWEDIKGRYAGNLNKVQKVATFLAESYMRKDDTEKCIKDLESLGFGKEAAAGITDYLKAYAMGPAGNMEMEMAMDAADTATPETSGGSFDAMLQQEEQAPAMDAGAVDPTVPPTDGMGMDDAAPALPPPGMDDGMDAPDMGGDLGGDPNMVTIDIPMDVAQQIADKVNGDVSPMDPMDSGNGDVGSDLPADDMGNSMDIEVVDVTDGDAPGGDLHSEDEGSTSDFGGDDVEEVSDEVVPGEPSEGTDDHVVESTDVEEASGSSGKCPHCGHADKKEEAPKFEGKKDDAEEAENKEFGEKVYNKEAGNMRRGHLRKVAENVLKIGPEMSINNTDQLGGHDDKKLGNAKEKTVDEPKALHDGNVELEGHSAGEKKYQDKSTMGHEEAFDAKEFDKGSSTGGKSSLMGKDESFPEGKPQVPAGSAPIGGEVWEGGNLATKGTVIATITNKGVLVEAEGKKFIAKHTITKEMLPAVQAGLAEIKETDGRKFASAALALLKKADCSGKVENVTKIDTSKLEGSTFTNDAEKKPDEGGAMTGKGKASKDDDHPTTDTSKKEADHFQNDADKKPEKDASSSAQQKVAKAVEEPKALEDGNVKSEGHTAGGDKFSDGKTMGHEEKPNFKTVEKSEVSKGSASEIGKDEEFPTGKADVPAGGGKMGHEEFDGGNVSTKGTTIAETQAQKRESSVEELQAKLNEAKVERERMCAASVYVADLLRNGEITEAEYSKELEKTAKMSVPAIQQLIASTRKTRERVVAANARSTAQQDVKTAGLSAAIVVSSDKNEKSLKDRLIAAMKLNTDMDRLDEMGK